VGPLLGGLMLAVSHARFAAWPFAHVALLPMLFVAARNGMRRSACAGMLTILPTMGAVCHWLTQVEPRPGKLVVVTGFCVSLVSMWAIMGMIFRLALRQRHARWSLTLPLVAWGLETARAEGFVVAPFLGPFFVLGQAQVSSGNPLLPSASVVGVGGLSAVVVLGNIVVAGLIGRGFLRSVLPVAAALLIAVPLAGTRGSSQAATIGMLDVAVMQADIHETDPRLRTYRAYEPVRRIYDGLAAAAVLGGARMMVWPEQAVPFAVRSYPPARTWLDSLVAATEAVLIVGANGAAQDAGGGWEGGNATLLFDPQGHSVQTHGKRFSAPLETPSPLRTAKEFRRRWGWRGRGAGADMLLDHPYGPVASCICFEAVMSRAVGEAVRGGGVLIAMSGNDAAFAGGRGTFHSLRHMMGRAVEYRRWVCRAANRGYTGFVAPNGELVTMRPPGEPTISLHRVPLRDDMTLFAEYGPLAEDLAVTSAVAWGILLLWAPLAAGWRRRRSHATGS
jgi:apolipoprotein N-acyltransferase